MATPTPTGQNLLNLLPAHERQKVACNAYKGATSSLFSKLSKLILKKKVMHL